MSIILNLYVTDVVRTVVGTMESTVFTVSTVGPQRETFRVLRNQLEDETVWTCACEATGTCDHIQRAALYHRNMMTSLDNLKRRAKDMAAENLQRKEAIEPSPHVPFLDGKRKIRLEE